ncbi:MAG: cupin domain-containing protein [Acidimicrobiales bacterium]
MEIRRVATGHDAQGRAVFVSDEAVAPVTLALVPGWEFHRLWGADARPRFPDDGHRPDAPLYFPPLEGFRFAVFTIPPDGGQGVPADLDLEGAIAEFQQKVPGMAEHLETEHPGMHTTATVDVGVVLAGEATLELDDGAKTTLGAGDTYVMNGTRHRWSNKGPVPAVIVVALVGAHHERVS